MATRTGGLRRWMALFLCVIMFASMLPIGSAFAEGEAEVVFSVSPSAAKVSVQDQEGNKVEEKEGNSYLLSPGTYTYTVSCEGYVSKESIEFTVPTSDKMQIDVEKKNIPLNSPLTS